MRIRFCLQCFVWLALLQIAVIAQSPDGTISGLVLDQNGRAIVGADIQIVNDVTGVRYPGTTNSEGIYEIPNLPPGPYRIQVSRVGFKTLIKPDIVLNVQAAVAINFTLPVGAFSETLTVEGGAPLVNTESATVSTVVDRQFAENLPMNGRSFQTLIELTPGVVPATSNSNDGGQFNINGQRANANYWMVDGVSANIGIAAIGGTGNGLSGSLGSFSALGGTNSLVSVDALQEFRIQTSTYAPEFGRTPGGQISIVTRSGTNQFHGTMFDYLRNDLFDANNWFADNTGQPKPKERQNDFGGTLGGPIVKNRTFFFFSYEGLRLRIPQTLVTTVPDLGARSMAVPSLQPFLNAFPLPNGPDNVGTGTAQFNASFSNPATLDAYSLRIDHRMNEKLSLFGRYNYSPSVINQRAAGGSQALSVQFPSRITTLTATLGVVFLISPTMSNELRLNYSRTASSSSFGLDNFGGATSLAAPPFPAPFTFKNAELFFDILSLNHGSYEKGEAAENAQRQFNVIDNVALQRGPHEIKLGVDYRRLTPHFGPDQYSQGVFFANVPAAASGNASFALLGSNVPATFQFQNLGAFAQDTWRIGSSLTLTYGLRWDVDFAPSTIDGPTLAAVEGFNPSDLSRLAIAPSGTPPFRTTFGDLAPRVGLAYQLLHAQDRETVLRAGFGVFYDMASSETGNILAETSYPFGAFQFLFGEAFPFNSATQAPPLITVAGLSKPGSAPLAADDPNLLLPYTLQWSSAVEQGVGKQQTVSISYIGSLGRRLIQTAIVSAPNPNFNSAYLVANTASSDYNALQIQFQRQLRGGLQALASYTWSHSIDTASSGSTFVGSNSLVPQSLAASNRGPSDFDIRHVFSAAATYAIPAPKINPFAKSLLSDWSIQNVVQLHSAPPINIFEADFSQLAQYSTQIRPDLVLGQPLYLSGRQYPGGKALNPAAFIAPPVDSSGNPTRQGNLGRNSLRGFGLSQWDLAIHRDFRIRDPLQLMFRAELFNVLNHPNFGPPQSGIGMGDFGQSTQILADSLGGNVGAGGFNALYQLGGPRSVQFALKLQF
ncbi:MAG: TonB-dependent receptor domain-containing protein [Terriglobales bacterium]